MDYLRARRTDPPSSHLAAEEVEQTGKAETQKAQVLKALQSVAGSLTSLEIAQLFNLSRYDVARRLPELERDGKVLRGKARTCSVGNRQAVTWEAA